jgi:hypothetical protein
MNEKSIVLVLAPKDSKLVLELDWDGVCYNTHENILKLASKYFNQNISEQSVKNYDYNCLPKEIRQFVFDCFINPRVMANQTFLYEDTIDFLQEINQLNRFNITIRTLVLNNEVANAREKFIKNLFKKYNIHNIKLNIELGKKHPKFCDVLIEDNPSAILNKKDGLVIMKKQPYNDFIKEENNIIIRNNLIDILDILKII